METIFEATASMCPKLKEEHVGHEDYWSRNFLLTIRKSTTSTVAAKTLTIYLDCDLGTLGEGLIIGPMPNRCSIS